MTKKIKKLEKETTLWRTKWETNNQALLQMAEEKTLRDKHYKGLHGKLECLEKLCQALQKERDDLTTKLGDLQSTTEEEGTGPPDPQPSQESTQDEMSPPGRGKRRSPLLPLNWSWSPPPQSNLTTEPLTPLPFGGYI
uniref:alpha-taxilin-like n=1 Tax=Oncorhynchus gorbuscha TaxID=8017 RepID=UPI001EAEF387|nr:alpha-taxilin-like [Oncorhynchus gorbuscha]